MDRSKNFHPESSKPAAYEAASGAKHSPKSGRAAIATTGAGNERTWWDRPSILYMAASVIVTASVVTDILTLGLDAEQVPFTRAAALSLVRMAATR